MEYFKINSLWKREEYVKGLPKGSHGRLIEGDYSEPEFGNIKHWWVEEKIDGINIRIVYKDGKVSFSGRKKDSQVPSYILEYLKATFSDILFNTAFPSNDNEPYPHIILFGEGYGPKIQACGSNYRNDVSFILFDIWANGWWLKREDVKLLGSQLSTDVVPHIGVFPTDEIIQFVKSKPLSLLSLVPQMMEGVVCRSHPLMLFRNGKPIIFKLKTRDLL